MQELFRGESGNSARSSKKSVTTSSGRLLGSAALELFCFYKDEVLMRDCSVAWVRPAEPSRIGPRMRTPRLRSANDQWSCAGQQRINGFSTV